MKSIEVAVLNPEVIPSAEKMMVCAARLTQRGHKIKSLDDFMALYNKSYTEDTVTTMTKLPHPTIQKFGAINVVIVGASRRFLAQITRHQNEVKFMSASLQYSDYSDDAAFAIPYEVMERGEEETYLTSCKLNMANYAEAVRYGLDNDAAGYMAPQGLRNVLIISATPYPDGDTSILECPCCGSGEWLHNADESEANFCGQCGQAIDWTKPEVHCEDCEHLTFSDCYGECGKGYKGIVQPGDSCGKGEHK